MALAVPLSRFTSRVGGGSAFFVRLTRAYDFIDDILLCGGGWFCHRLFAFWSSDDSRHQSRVRRQRVREPAQHLFLSGDADGRRIASQEIVFRLHERRSGLHFIGIACRRSFQTFMIIDRQPNKSPEPTAVGTVSSAIAVHVASRRWLSFFR